jgi:hypothetical protein
MPKPDDRGSLMNLRANLPKVAPVETTQEMERRIMGVEDNTSLSPNIQEDVRKDVSPYGHEPAVNSAGERRSATNSGKPRREGTVLLNAKVPVSLHVRLKRTSQYNDISMTDILLRGIEAELDSGKYSIPPETWGTDQ